MFKFEVPSLTVGTLDTLMTLSDELGKTDAVVEALFRGASRIGDADLFAINPPDNEVVAGVYPGLTLIAAADFGIDYSYSIAQISAYTAARIMVEALQQAGRNLSREALVSALESMDDFHPGLVPPVSYGPERRIGTTGGHIVNADLVNGRFDDATRWIELDRAD